MKKVVSLFFALSLLFNVLLCVVLLYQNNSLPVAGALNLIQSPGTYGPPAMELVDGDTTIRTAGVTLQNTLITGNLYLTEEVNQGTITLDRVEVQGEVNISGGSFTLVLSDCSLADLVVRGDGNVTIIAKGSTVVDVATLSAEASLQEDALSALGFKDVIVSTEKKIILLGDFENLEITGRNANVKTVKGSIANISVLAAAANSVLELAKDVQVEDLTLGAVSTLLGTGSVQAVDINVPGLHKLQGILGEVSCLAEGIFLELQSGSLAKLFVPELEAATSIDLAEETMVESMELNGRTGITGQGQIGTVSIKHPGVTIDQTPAKVTLEKGLSAMIGGEEIKEAEPKPQPAPEPVTPSVVLNAISNVDFKDFGEKKTITLSATPGASFSVSSSNTVASVSRSGNAVIITGNRQGTATVTVKATLSGYKAATRTFKVTVNPIKNVQRQSMDQFTSTIRVDLHTNDPGKYKVVLNGHGELQYDPEYKSFWAVVSKDVLNNSISVTGR